MSTCIPICIQINKINYVFTCIVLAVYTYVHYTYSMTYVRKHNSIQNTYHTYVRTYTKIINMLLDLRKPVLFMYVEFDPILDLKM